MTKIATKQPDLASKPPTLAAVNPTPGPVPSVQAPALTNWKFNLRGAWLHPVLVLEGLPDEAAARKALHDKLDQAIFAVERTR